MRIGNDGRFLVQDSVEGMVVYSKQLLRQLSPHYPSYQYFFFFDSSTQDFENTKSLNKKENTRKVIIRIQALPQDQMDLKLFFDISLSFHLKKNKIDIFHALRYFVPPEGKIKIVTTFHDLFALVIPEFNPKAANRVRRLWYAQAIKISSKIIAVYHSTKNDLLKFFNLPSEKIIVIHEAAAATFRPIKDEGF